MGAGEAAEGGRSDSVGAHWILSPLSAGSPPLSVLGLVPKETHCEVGDLQKFKGL